jgi:c-di-GMP-binding flagellar brake protein YcgR
MSLISVEEEKLIVGEPLPWTIYDQDRNVIMEAGQVIESDDHLELLLSNNPLRELTWPTAGNDTQLNKKTPSENDEAEASFNKAEQSVFGFKDMRLRVGDRIQLQPPAAMGTERYIVRMLGYLDNVSLMVTAPVFNGMRVQVREHDKIVARVFSSQKAFGFDCTVLRVCKLPYDYLHLSFPDVVQGALVRKSPRIKTKIITSISRGDGNDSGEKLSGVIIDLSADGAMIKSKQQLADKSHTITLSFRVHLHNMEAYLTTKAIIRNVFSDEEKDPSDPLKYHHGVQFLDLQPNDSVILQSLIYQQMIEQPHTLT